MSKTCKDCKWYDNGICTAVEDLEELAVSYAKPACNKFETPVSCSDCTFYDMRREVCAGTGYTRKPDAIACGLFKPETDSVSQGNKSHDAVNAPDHYCHGGIECKDCIKAALGDNYIGFLIGNVIKYTYRYRHKNGIEDLKKAQVYLGWAIDELAGESDDM